MTLALSSCLFVYRVVPDFIDNSSTPFRYDPNDLSAGDEDDSDAVRSAIKNLNFSKIASTITEHGAGSDSREGCCVSPAWTGDSSSGERTQCSSGPGAGHPEVGFECAGPCFWLASSVSVRAFYIITKGFIF